MLSKSTEQRNYADLMREEWNHQPESMQIGALQLGLKLKNWVCGDQKGNKIEMESNYMNRGENQNLFPVADALLLMRIRFTFMRVYFRSLFLHLFDKFGINQGI